MIQPTVIHTFVYSNNNFIICFFFLNKIRWFTPYTLYYRISSRQIGAKSHVFARSSDAVVQTAGRSTRIYGLFDILGHVGRRVYIHRDDHRSAHVPRSTGHVRSIG